MSGHFNADATEQLKALYNRIYERAHDRRNNKEILDLLTAGADPNFIFDNSWRSKGYSHLPTFASTPLTDAILKPRPQLIGQLLKHGANPNLYSDAGANETPLTAALSSSLSDKQRFRVVKQLLKAGANPNKCNAVLADIPLLDALQHDDLRVPALLLKHGANPRHMLDEAKKELVTHRLGERLGMPYLMRNTEDKSVLVVLLALLTPDLNTAGFTPFMLLLKRYCEVGLPNSEKIGLARMPGYITTDSIVFAALSKLDHHFSDPVPGAKFESPRALVESYLGNEKPAVRERASELLEQFCPAAEVHAGGAGAGAGAAADDAKTGAGAGAGAEVVAPRPQKKRRKATLRPAATVFADAPAAVKKEVIDLTFDD